MSYVPDEIYIEKDVADLRFTKQILSRLPQISRTVLVEPTNRGNHIFAEPDAISAGKRILFLAKQKGSFIKPCPCTSNYIGCNYYILNLATNCDMDCSYCILQWYLNNPWMVIYVNLEDFKAELNKFLVRNRQKFFRIGTGELTDSLTLEPITEFSKLLVPLFAGLENATLELKTKSTHIEPLLPLEHNGRTVISWSLNPPEIIAREEKGTPTLTSRLEAAKLCESAGYKIGFHFDPVIHYSNWKCGYSLVVQEIFKYVNPESIAWISLGGLRYPPQLDKTMRQRHYDSQIPFGELFLGKDGKLRYLKVIRQEMFKRIVQWIHDVDPDIFVYLCMESPEVWEYVFGRIPGGRDSLSNGLDRRCGVRTIY